MAGLGLEYTINKNIAIRGEYEHVFSAGGSSALDVSSHDTGLLSLSFIYKFGSKERTVVKETIKYIQVFITDETEEESLFKNGETELNSTETLAKIVKKIQSQPYVFIKVIGHTDNIGSEEENQALSEQRAQSVANYLRSQGIDRERMVVIGKGEINPLADNTIEEERAKNRRVEIIVERIANYAR